MTDQCIGKDCSVRGKDLSSRQNHFKRVDASHLQWLRDVLLSEGNTVALLTDPNTKLCLKCYQRYRRKHPSSEGDLDSDSENRPQPHKKSTPNPVSEDRDGPLHDQCQVSDDDAIPSQLPHLTIDSLFYSPISHRRCAICLKYSDDGLEHLPEAARISLLFYCKLWCPAESRVCSEHLLGPDIHPDLIVDLSNRTPLKDCLAERSEEIINHLLEVSRELSKSNSTSKLQYNQLSNDAIKAWTGWSSSEFTMLHDMCSEKPTQCSSAYDALLLFWAKLKTNISWPQLSVLCGLSKRKTSKVFHMVLTALNETVVRTYFGISHLTREEAVMHNTCFTRTFYGENVTLILDGTYIYVQKSTDHQLQKSSFCGHKKRNYVKFMSVVLPDGYVMDSVGPFYGNQNDASITKQIMENIEGYKQWLQEDDVIIVDRGFRDVLDLLESAGYKTKMPSSLGKGEKQLSADSANTDRLCTKTRWVVVSYHGRLKAWRFFKEQLTSNYFIKVIKELVSIVSAGLNFVRGPIYKSTPERDLRDQQLANRMMAKLSIQSPLAQKVKSDPDLSRRASSLWKKLDAMETDFPTIDLEYLETMACGSYQVKQATGYISEHLTDAGDFGVLAYQHSDGLVRGQVRSRHKSQTKYNVWISYDKADKDDPVKDVYCQCPTGSRTVGMCAHTASIIYYLGHLAHRPTKRPLQTQTKTFKRALVSTQNK